MLGPSDFMHAKQSETFFSCHLHTKTKDCDEEQLLLSCFTTCDM